MVREQEQNDKNNNNNKTYFQTKDTSSGKWCTPDVGDIYPLTSLPPPPSPNRIDFALRRAGDFWASPEMQSLFPNQPNQPPNQPDDVTIMKYLQVVKHYINYPSEMHRLLPNDTNDKNLSPKDISILTEKCRTLWTLYTTSLDILPHVDMNWEKVIKNIRKA